MDDSWATSPAVRKAMQGNRSRDTKPELAVRRLVHAQGMRYRVNYRPIPDLRRTADVVFSRLKIAVFIDGCFWHGCPEHHTAPKANAAYWSAKVEANRSRDMDTTARLTAAGWSVLRFWSHEDPSYAVKEIQQAVQRAKQRP
ncbi:very short patch repair endonuclease [Arthrobacter sp. MDT3-44]